MGKKWYANAKKYKGSASKGEYYRLKDLELLEKAREIQNLRAQVKIPLKVNKILITTYIADAVYEEKVGDNWQLIVEDHKGSWLTPIFKIKWKLAKALFPEVTFRIHQNK